MDKMCITFWGVRGSCPTYNHRMCRYGTNTSCVQININNRILIMDAGTGICQLGEFLYAYGGSIHADIFLTHTHWDHIQGLPFFKLAFEPKHSFNLYGERKKHLSLETVIKEQLKYPYSPITWDNFLSEFNFFEISGDNKIDIGDGIIVSTLSTDHPGGNIAYRVDFEGKSCCYITDLEHKADLNDKLVKFVFDTDVLIYDSFFTEAEYEGRDGTFPKHGWGHSTWEKGIKLAKDSNAKQIVFTHHKIDRSDCEIDQLLNYAKSKFENSLAAKQGMRICI